MERRRLFCAVLFHCAAALCVIWSLCVLIERAAEEVRRGLIGWPFWTKLVVVTVGLTGGVVFMYIQCKQYLNLCNRWRARNRILLIQNAPEKMHPPQSPGIQRFPRVRTAATSGGIGHNGNGSGGPGSSASYNSGNNSGPLHRGYHQQLIGSIGGGHACELQINQQGQIIAANIENSSINYDRDWTLDDISQMSFKPCPQGSGSLTPMPFHDSVHNVCEGSGSGSGVVVATHRYSAISGSSNTVHEEDQLHESMKEGNNGSSSGGSIKTADLNLFKVPNAELGSVNSSTGIQPVTNSARYPSSAIFLENRDILDDPPCHDQIINHQTKLYSRRSTVLDSSSNSFTHVDPRNDTRRYSDTKLLQQQKLSYVSEQPVDNSPTKDQLLLNPKSIIYDMTSFLGPVVAQDHEGSPSSTQHHLHRAQHHHHHHRVALTTADSPSHRIQTTDIQFDNNCDEDSARPRATSYDPLELNIQEMLELDIANIQRLHEKKSSLGNISQHSSSSYCQDDPSSPCLGQSPAKVRPTICTSASNTRLQQQQHAIQIQLQMPQPLQAQSAVQHRPIEVPSSSCQQFNSNRLKLFKSLPNLSASSENLLPPPKRFD